MPIKNISSTISRANGHILGLIDQSLLSGTSFFTLILIARWSSSEVIGQIALILNIMTFCILIHQSFSKAFTFFSAREKDDLQSLHLREFLSIHLPLVFLIGFCLIVIPFFLYQKSDSILLSLIMSLLLIGTSLIYESQRRILWALGSGDSATMLAVFRTVVFVFSLLIIKTFNLVFTTVVALAWILSTRLVAIPKFVKFWMSSKNDRVRATKIYLNSYWDFSRWILLRSFLSYLAGNIYIPLVALLLGFEKTGQFEVGRQLIAPFFIIPMGISSYLLPKLSIEFKKLKKERFNKEIFKIFKIWLSGSFVLSCALALFGQEILELIIGDKSKYYNINQGFCILAILGFSISLNIFSEIFISSIGQPELGWKPMGMAALANGVIGIPLIMKFEVVGAFAGNALTSMVAAILVLRAAFNVSKIYGVTKNHVT